MAISSNKQEGYSLVKVAADKLDTMLAPDLKSEFVFLEKSGEEFAIVDLSDVKYCDSSGLSALLVGNRLLKEKGGMILFGLQPNVKKLVEISQLHTVLNIADDLSTAEAMI